MPSESSTAGEYDTDVVGSRAVAQVIDLVLSGAVFLAVALALRSSVGLGVRPSIFLASPVLVVYGGVLEGYWNGQTVGKWFAGVQVRTQDGTEVRPVQAFLRNLPAAAMPGLFVYLVALLAIATSEQRQRVFDQVAETIVVKRY